MRDSKYVSLNMADASCQLGRSLCSHTRDLLEHGDDLGPVEERLGIRPQKQVRTFDRPKLAKHRPLPKVHAISASCPLYSLVLLIDAL